MRIFLIIVLISIGTICAQNNQQIIIGEDFDGISDYKWTQQNDDKVSAIIENEYYNIEVKDSRTSGLFNTTSNINLYKEFNIKSKISNLTAGNQTHIFGLTWGGKSKNDCFVFFINTVKQTFAVYKNNAGKTAILIPWTKSKEIKTDGTINELDLITMDGYWHYYINGKPQKKSQVQPLLGNNVGIYTMGKLKLKIYDYYVSGTK